jgi:hypothetical protein
MLRGVRIHYSNIHHFYIQLFQKTKPFSKESSDHIMIRNGESSAVSSLNETHIIKFYRRYYTKLLTNVSQG